MKSAGLLATFSLILLGQIARAQQNALFNDQNIENNNLVSQQPPPNTMVNIVQRYLNQNGKTGALPNNNNQRQGLVEISSPTSLTNTQKLQQPPDLKQYPQLPPLLQQKQPLPLQQFSQVQQPLQLQQPLQVQQPLQTQQPVDLQRNPLQQMPSFQENKDLIQSPVTQQQSNYQQASIPQIHLKLQPANSQGINIGQPINTQNVIQPQTNPNLRSVEFISPQQQAFNKNQDISAIRYHISSQQPSPLNPSNPPVVSNPSIALIPSYNIKPIEQTYIPPYNYIQPVPEIPPAVIERATATSSVQALPSIITLPSPVVQNTQTPTQTYYYGQASDPRQNVYVNQNPGFRYPHQSQTSLTAVQTQPTAVISSQPSVLSPVPVSIVQAPQVTPQYAISSAYPVNTIMAPAYTTQKSKSLNLKSYLPLIFNLLKEKIASGGCQNGCPCGCKKKSSANEPEVLSGYSSQRNYGALKGDGPSVLNTVSEESEGCLRTRKNCIKNEKVSEVSDVREVSDESQDEDSDEEEVSDEEED